MNTTYKKIFSAIVAALIAITGAIYYFAPNEWSILGTTNKLQQTETSLNSLQDFYNAGKDSAKAENKTEITFLAVGDIMLSRNVAGQIQKYNSDSFWPFRNIENTLLSSDFNFGNLESPFSGSDNFSNTGSLVFNAPTWTMPGLAQYNFKVLNLANNHALDQGLKGIIETKRRLTENNILSIGVGTNLDEAWQTQIYSVKGVRVGFVGASYSSLNDNGAATSNYVARIEDETRLKKAIEGLKTKSDFVVVTMHAGTEYKRDPNEAQVKFARTAVDAGADMVIGAHPHWIQTSEIYKGKYIFYSLGNFVFDQMWSQDTKEGLMLQISLEKNGNCANNSKLSPTGQQEVTCGSDLQGSITPAKLKQIKLIPIIIENYGQPRIANETEKQSILKKIGSESDIIKP